jgi:serine/threonine protein kinase
MRETQKLEEIFSRAILLSTLEERCKYVKQACEGDVGMEEQVHSLLASAQEAGNFLEPPLRGTNPVRDVTQMDVSWNPTPRELKYPFLSPPRESGDLGSLGPYRILNQVGRGGMGIVFRAFDSKLQRIVAIKVLAPEIAIDPMARRRFEREARSAAAISHPHVVVIYAVDEICIPPYLVMEFVQGKTLADKLATQGALTIKEILRIGSQVAEGLAAAHQQGLVHRDMKPANILLENGVERVKVTDFGLAKVVNDGTMTRTGDLSGTPHFMSPEQASGGPIDLRSDLFSLGAILYLMCSGRTPFRADNPLALLKRVCEETPGPISRINPEIPDWLSQIVSRLLEKSPTDRYQTAAEVVAVLQQHLAMIQAWPNVVQLAPEKKSQPAMNSWRRWHFPILAFEFLVALAVLVWFVHNRNQSSSSHITDRMSDSMSPASVDQTMHDGKKGMDRMPLDESLMKNDSEPAATEDLQCPREERDDNVLKMKLCWCPAGTTPGFWIGKYEVTQSEWANLMGSLPSHALDKGKGDQHPIYYVSHADAAEFCRKLSDLERKAGRLPAGWEYELPTDNEWEYACRAGTMTASAFGDSLSSTQANFNGDWPHNGGQKGPSLMTSVKVGLYCPNDWGIYDMHGNVGEFTAMSGRVRGGSWCDSGRNCCSEIFIPIPPTPFQSVGFRVALVSKRIL